MNGFGREQPLVVGSPARAGLLPPEIAAARAWRRTVRGLIAGCVAVVVLSAAAVGSAYVGAQDSAARLARAQTTTQGLLINGQKFSSVTALQAHIAQATAAKGGVTANWIDWQTLMGQVEDALPTGTCLTTFAGSTTGTASAQTGAAAPVAASGSAASLAVPAGTVASVSLGAATADLGDVQEWIAALSGLPGYLEADPGSVTSSGTGPLTVTLSLYLGPKVYSTRTEPSGAPATPAPTPTPTVSPTCAGDSATTPSPTPVPTAPSGQQAAVANPAVVPAPMPTVTVTVPVPVYTNRPATAPTPSTPQTPEPAK